jgi:DNA replication protein DnaC
MDRCPLDTCDGTGFVVDEQTRTATPCGCRAQLVSRRKARSLSAVLPKKYKDVSLDRNPIAQMPDITLRPVRAYLRNLGENLATGRGLCLVGEVGTGKTTIAMLVAKEALAAGHSVAVYSMPRLLNEIRRTYDEGSDSSYVELLDRLAEVDLLQLDDVGAERSSPWVLEQLYTIVNSRYEGERAITMTTNLDFADLVEQIGHRTVSRLREMCEAIPLDGHDHRPVRQSA